VLVPVVYSIFDDWGQKIGRKTSAEEVEAEEGIEA
jgi:hypothetical protein